MVKWITKKILWTVVSILAGAAIIFALFYFIEDDPATCILAKPVIYLYPEAATDVEITVDCNGGLDFTYPEYNAGWHVTAYPDGRMINRADGREYSYLFWEGKGHTEFDMSSGFVVKGSDTAVFLREKLELLGLSPKEYNEFIVYWAPLMRDHAYNLISFQSDAYTEAAKLDVSPVPDSVLRVFMAYKALGEPVEVPEQRLETFQRIGFTVVEWGGAEVK